MGYQFLQEAINKSGFIVLAYIFIAGGTVTQVLPCQTQKILHNNIVVKHIIGILLIFACIMMEGGWDFDSNENAKADSSWGRGNTIHSMIFAVILYSTFLASSYMQYSTNIVLYIMLLLIYICNSYRNYLVDRNRITPLENKMIIIKTKILMTFCLILLIYGIYDYLIYKKTEFKDNFSLYNFIVGTIKCKGMS